MSNQACGGAEGNARSTQYGYAANSSLVLNSDTWPGVTHDPTGEAESLRGKIDPKSFGDRAFMGVSVSLELLKKKAREEREVGLEKQRKKRRVFVRGKVESVVTTVIEEGLYHPRTKETSAAYDVLLGEIDRQLGGQAPQVVRSVADEVLTVDAPRYPKEKEEGWWLVVGNSEKDELLAIKRVTLQMKSKVNLQFAAPCDARKKAYTLYFIVTRILAVTTIFQ